MKRRTLEQKKEEDNLHEEEMCEFKFVTEDPSDAGLILNLFGKFSESKDKKENYYHPIVNASIVLTPEEDGTKFWTTTFTSIRSLQEKFIPIVTENKDGCNWDFELAISTFTESKNFELKNVWNFIRKTSSDDIRSIVSMIQKINDQDDEDENEEDEDEDEDESDKENV